MRFDPVTLDIIWNRLISICDEAETGLMRTAFSAVVREGRDFSCFLLDPEGNSIAQGSLSLVLFLCAAPLTAKKVLEKFPAETLEPGDIVITNDPWSNPGHLYDVFALEPIFHRGQLIALAGSVAHWPDIGGRGMAADNRSIFEEGLQLPALKIAKRGRFNEEVMEIIRENVRFPDEVMGDFRSQLVGNNLIRTKLTELIERQGIEDFGALSETILGRSEAAMRNAISKIPDGDYENEIHRDGIDRELTVKVRVSVRGTDMHVDYAGSSPQTEWSINSMPSFTYAYTFFGIKAAVAPHLPNNSGQMRPVRVSMPLGSIVNPVPRSVGAARSGVVGAFCCPVVYGALAKAILKQGQAETLPDSLLRLLGVSENARPFQAQCGGASGMGGRHDGDGPCIPCPSTKRNTPTEVMEYLAPAVLIEWKKIRADSGGPGMYRGGCGVDLGVKIIGQASAVCHPRIEGTEHPARGMLGGHSGVTAHLTLNGSSVSALRTFAMVRGDRLSVRMAGGGGYGDPLERDPFLVLEDVLDDLVSPEQAEANYGVVIDAATKRLDLEATASLRLSRRLK